MRKLASIQEIVWKRPIEGRDKIELCGVLGWSLITKKDEFQIGDQCVYIEIDSVVPAENPQFAFLESKKYRIKTMKMAGVYSQGICFPLSILPEKDWKVGDDVTDILGIKQYEPTMDIEREEPQTKQKKSWLHKKLMRYQWYRNWYRQMSKADHTEFPTAYVSKTDETRIQQCPWLLEDKTTKWTVTEKIDGSSGTFLLVRHDHKFRKPTYEFMVCSRNRRIPKDDGSAFWVVAHKYDIENKLKAMLKNMVLPPDRDSTWIALQGEVIAPKIQKNKYKVDSPDLYIYNLITQNGGRWKSPQARLWIEEYGMKFVPIVESDFTLLDSIDEMLDYATGESALGNTIREGFVFRQENGTGSFKAVSPKFLVKYDE